MKTMFFLDKVPARWARCCAQIVDYLFLYLAVSLSSLFLPFYVDDLAYLGLVIVLPFLWMPIEAFLLSKYKTTPGKKIFGIRVEDHLAGKLPFWIALKRTCFWGRRPGLIRQTCISGIRSCMSLVALVFLMSFCFFEQEIVMVTTGWENYRTIDGWIDYTSTEGNFKVLFPDDPYIESKMLPVPSQHRDLQYQELTSYQGKKVYYSISYMGLPRKWKLAGSHRLLQGALDLIVEHMPEAKLLCKNMTKHQTFRALDFHLEQGEEEVQGRLILVGTTLYRLTVVYPPELAHQLQHHAFLDSFEVQG